MLWLSSEVVTVSQEGSSKQYLGVKRTMCNISMGEGSLHYNVLGQRRKWRLHFLWHISPEPFPWSAKEQSELTIGLKFEPAGALILSSFWPWPSRYVFDSGFLFVKLAWTRQFWNRSDWSQPKQMTSRCQNDLKANFPTNMTWAVRGAHRRTPLRAHREWQLPEEAVARQGGRRVSHRGRSEMPMWPVWDECLG